MQQSNTSIPDEITHPETGARMVRDRSQGSDAMRPRLERNIANLQSGAEVLTKIREKEDAEGFIYVDPVTQYRARVRPNTDQVDAAAGSAEGRQGAAGAPQSPADREARRRALIAELDALDR